MVLPASDAGEEADPISTSILRSVDPKTCPGNIYHHSETAGKWQLVLEVWILPAGASVSLSFSSFQLTSVLWEISP